jgi:Domain of unknown function (DUF222)/HNH endonuclease
MIDTLVDGAKAVAVAQARHVVDVATFVHDSRKADVAGEIESGDAGRSAITEVALALRVSRGSVERQYALGRTLIEDFPCLLEAFLAGEVTQAACWKVASGTEVLDSSQRRAIDPDVTADALQMTPPQLERALRHRVIAIDPAGACRRAERARANKSVRPVMLPDGVATLANVLPAEDVLASWKALDDQARSMRADGDERSLRELTCDLFVERLTGTARTPKSRQPVEVGVVVAVASLLGYDSEPATMVGYGAIPSDLARRLASGDSVFARRLVCDPIDGSLLSMDTKRRRFDGPLRTFLKLADQTCRQPVCGGPVRELDHIQPYAEGGPTSGRNGESLCKPDHIVRYLKGWRLSQRPHPRGGRPTVIWRTPSGRTYESRPPPVLGPGS